MGLLRPILPALLAVALSAYGFDCSAMTTPEQAMQCCNSMHCSSPAHHGQDCCKRMPSVRSPFVQPSSVHGMSFSPAVLAVMPTRGELPVLTSRRASYQRIATLRRSSAYRLPYLSESSLTSVASRLHGLVCSGIITLAGEYL